MSMCLCMSVDVCVSYVFIHVRWNSQGDLVSVHPLGSQAQDRLAKSSPCPCVAPIY